MSLKKMLALATFCLTQTLSATENPQEIDPFFTDPKTTITITVFFDSENMRKAYITGEADGQKETTTLPTVFTDEKGWRHNDAKLKSNRILFGAVKVGSQRVEQEAPFQAPVEYKNNETTEGSQEELVPGKTVFVYKIQNYERPDGTIYQKLIKALHRLRMEEQRKELADLLVTVREEKKVRPRGLHTKLKGETCYTMQNYAQTEVRHFVTRLAPTDTEDKSIEDPTIIEEPTITKTFRELRPKGSSYTSFHNDGAHYPSNYKIVN